jgi:hypothetical protein
MGLHSELSHTELHGSMVESESSLPTPEIIGQLVEVDDVIYIAHATSAPSDFKPIAQRNNLTATTDPSSSDDGYPEGAKWVNTDTNKVWFCAHNATSNAVWKEVGSISGAAPVDAKYITQVADGTLTNEQALSALATGEMIVTTSTGEITSIKYNIAASAAPTVNDDSGDGYVVGSLWIDTTNDKIYRCTDNSSGAAVWPHLSSGASDPAKLVGAKAYTSGTTEITSSNDAAVAFASESYDTDTIHDNSSNNTRLTCKTAGYYYISAQIGISQDTGSPDEIVGYLYIKSDGTTNEAMRDIYRQAAADGEAKHFAIFVSLLLAVNEYVEIWFQNDAGHTLTVEANARSFAEMHLIGLEP